MIAALFFIASMFTGLTGVTGIVHDASGAVVPGAAVVVRAAARPGGADRRTVTGPDGRFTIDVSGSGLSGEVVVVVRAAGFAEVQQRVAAGAADVDITLLPAALLQEVTVTATRTEQRLGDVPASVSVLLGEEIKQSPAVVADDLLRRLPAFSLFRRTSSLSSHPTAQGVSLRGVGPSGVSRTLVLLDSVPFNDPFGGWVYWTRVPLESADRIEVMDGSGSSLYGNFAMGGVINIVSTRPARRTAVLKAQYGSRASPKVDFFGSDVWGRLGAAVEGSAFDTSGFPIVAASERGRVDNKAAVDFRNVNVKLEYNPTSGANVFARAGYFRERRDNGKASTIDGTEEANDTTWRFVNGGVAVHLPDASDLQARVFADFETFHSNFLAVPVAIPARSIGRMTLNQSVPTTGVGGMAQWSKPLAVLGGSHHVTAGADFRWVDGDSHEDALDASTGTQVTLRRVSGGTQKSAGLFAQDVFAPLPELAVTVSARVDYWRNYGAHNLETTAATGLPAAGNKPSLPDRTDTVASPRVAALYHLTDRVSVWGDLGWGFRAPTLNELYRQFRVGALLTLANEHLGPERLVGGEAGITIAPAKHVTIRTTWFDNRVKNPVSNVTLTGVLNTQQRQNLGRTRIWGIQSDVEYRLGSSWRVSGGYLYDQAQVKAFAANPALVEKFLPQVPAHRASLRAAYANPRYATVALAMQFLGAQFDDDLNARVVPGYTTPGLPKYAVVDVTASRVIGRNIEMFAGVQNLFNTEYFVGTLPTTIGSPRLANLGVRIRVAGR